MNKNEITQLLEKYFQGETSLAEERALKAYFQQENIPESLQEFQPLFTFFQVEKSQHVQKELVFENIAGPRRQGTLVFLKKWIPRVAAAVLTVFSLWTMYPKQLPPQQGANVDWSKYEPENPEEAFRITHAALMKTSLGLQKGTSQAVKEMAKAKEVWKMFE
ncbi:MAG: hypothetical protein DHS20C18_47620 [Saprospiraceae bacterium]|nr:MAG: hypothetical protein DHS20C18_47620 [Saprospiraceae bacterium]